MQDEPPAHPVHSHVRVENLAGAFLGDFAVDFDTDTVRDLRARIEAAGVLPIHNANANANVNVNASGGGGEPSAEVVPASDSGASANAKSTKDYALDRAKADIASTLIPAGALRLFIRDGRELNRISETELNHQHEGRFLSSYGIGIGIGGGGGDETALASRSVTLVAVRVQPPACQTILTRTRNTLVTVATNGNGVGWQKLEWAAQPLASENAETANANSMAMPLLVGKEKFSWQGGAFASNWEGVRLDAAGLRVVGFTGRANNLALGGIIPTQIGEL